MGRIYIDADEARLTRRTHTTLDVEFIDGRKFELLEPHRLFPMTGLSKYISLVDTSGNEICIIRDISALIPDSRKAVEECLDEYYLIPKIKKILRRTEKYGIITWDTETDRGLCSFQIKSTISDIKTLYDGRILIKDANDNRYEIENVKKLDRKSLSLLGYDM